MAGLILAAKAFCQDINAEFDALTVALQSRDFTGSLNHALIITDFALAKLATLPPSNEQFPRLTYAAGTGDTSYLLTMVQQTRIAFQSGDFIRLREYSVSLGSALRQEELRQRPDLSQQLVKAEESANGLTGIRRFLALPPIAKAAFQADDLVRAASYANEMLVDAGDHASDWPCGDAIHQGNVVLGRIALQEGDVASAKARLLAAGRTTGSPTLNSFGPNMALASELLAAGQRDVVLQYLSECGRFWKSDLGALSGWTKAIQANKLPDFGANLIY